MTGGCRFCAEAALIQGEVRGRNKGTTRGTRMGFVEGSWKVRFYDSLSNLIVSCVKQLAIAAMETMVSVVVFG
jgi:hypothetical protein